MSITSNWRRQTPQTILKIIDVCETGVGIVEFKNLEHLIRLELYWHDPLCKDDNTESAI